MGKFIHKGQCMRYLWAPWRMEYILEKRQKGCIFCKKGKGKKARENLVLYQGKHTFVVMNKFPYNNGHLMVVPKRHCPDLEELDDQEYQEFFSLLRTSLRILRACFHPHGFNIGINLGKAGGAGVEEHVHLHVIPRWTGDTNFMPVIGETRVIPEHLETTYQKLLSGFKTLFPKNQKGVGRT